MHDVDATHGELNQEFGQEIGQESGLELSQELAQELAQEIGQELAQETGQEMGLEALESNEFGEFGENEQEGLGELSMESPINEATEMELAAELLEIQTEEELDQFIGKIFKGVAKLGKGLVKSPIFKTLGGALKGVAKVGLPIAGKLAGGFFGGPIGAAIGGQVGSLAGNLFEGEQEAGMMGEDEVQFEIARRFVRAAGAAVRRAGSAPSAPTRAVARRALVPALRRHAPVIASAMGRYGRGVGGGGPAGRARGRRGVPWRRRHRSPSYIYGRGGGGGGAFPEDGDDDGGGLDVSTQATSGRPPGKCGRWYRRGKIIVLVIR